MLVKKSRLKQMKDPTWQGFINAEIFSINTWPYEPSGTLRQPQSATPDPNESTDKIVEIQNLEFIEANHFVETFSEKQKSAVGWILAASIGVVGNLIVNLAFSSPSLGGNTILFPIVTIVLISLVIAYLRFLPEVTFMFKFVPSYKSFPFGYEQYITQAPCKNPHSRLIFSFNKLSETVTNFGTLVRLLILKDRLFPLFRKGKLLRISHISDVGSAGIGYFIEISTNGWKPWVDPKARTKIREELRVLVEALLMARQTCSVYQFELDPNEWAIKGCDFIDAVSDWDFDKMRKDVIDKLLRDELVQQ